MSSAVRRLGEEERRLIEVERPVDLAQNGARRARLSVPTTMRSGCLKSSIAEPSRRNSGLETTSKSASGRAARMMRLDLVAGADRNRRFGDDDGEAVHRRGDLARRCMDIGQIGMAIAAPRRRSDGDEHRVCLVHRGGQIGRETRRPWR